MTKNPTQKNTAGSLRSPASTPKLRFPGFEGVWEEKKIGQVLKIGSGKDYKHLNAGNVPVFGTGGYMLSVDKPLYSGESVMIGRKGTIDKPFYFDGDFWTVDTLFYTYDFENITPKFTHLIFQKINWKKYNEASGVPSLSKTTIEKIKINLPKLPEQQKIASFLGSVDEWVENLRSQKQNLEQYKKGIMQKIFSQEIRFKTENGKSFSDWEEKKLGDCLDYEQPTSYIVESTEYDDSFEVPVLTAGKSFILGYTNEKEGIYKDTPVIIFDDFTTTSQFVDFHFKVKSSAMKILKAKQDFNIKFIFEVMQQISYEIGGHGRHWISKYSNIKVLVPSLPEQQKIAEFLSSVDKSIESKQQQITLAENWKKGLMQGLFV